MMSQANEEQGADHPLFGRWVATDASKSLVVYEVDGAVFVDFFKELGPTRLVAPCPATLSPDGSIRAELGYSSAEAIYVLSPTKRAADGCWRAASVHDDHEEGLVLGARIASLLEAMLGPWDEQGAEMAEADAWAMPDTLYRRATTDERAT
jgi:hypothetical protein